APGRQFADLPLQGTIEIIKQHIFFGAVIGHDLLTLSQSSFACHLTVDVVDHAVSYRSMQIGLQVLDMDLIPVFPQPGKNILYELFAQLTRTYSLIGCDKKSPPVTPVYCLKGPHFSTM